MKHIFLSYSSKDRERVQPLIDLLGQVGPMWWDERIMHGASWDDEIEKALDEAACVVVAWTETSVDARFVKAEARYALKHGILVPVRLDPVDLPLEFSGEETALLEGWDGSPEHREARMLKDSVAAVIARGRLTPAPHSATTEAAPPIVPVTHEARPEPAPTASLPPGKRTTSLAERIAVAAVLGAMVVGGIQVYRNRGEAPDPVRPLPASDTAAAAPADPAPVQVDSAPRSPALQVAGIIISETALPSLRLSLRALTGDSTNSRGYHYMVDTDGRVYSYFDESRRAGHTPRLNGTHLGIGMVHASRSDAASIRLPYREYTPEQIDGLVALLTTLAHDHRLNVQSIRSREEVDPRHQREITGRMNEIRQRVSALLAEWRLNKERPAGARVRAGTAPAT